MLECFEEFLSFLLSYHTVIFLALLAFAPVFRLRRFGGSALAVLGAAYLLAPGIYNRVTGGYLWIADALSVSDWYSISFLLYWLLAMLIFFVAFRISINNVLFCGLAAYSVQWFTTNALTICRYLLFDGMRGLASRLVSLVLATVILLLFYIIFVRRLKTGQVNLDQWQLMVFLGLVLFSVNIFTQSWQHSYIAQDEFDNIEIYGTVFSMLIGLLLLVVQFGIFEQSRLRQEKYIVEEMLRSFQKQYELSKANIEVINRKCHDMRHQIRALRAITDEQQRQALFTETENAIQIYSDIARTGNEALDVVLTEKSLICEEKGIDFSYVLNGEDLSFIDTVDIYSLFGNALDNAIESVSQCKDQDKRIITVREQRRGSFVNLTIENYCEAELTFVDGLPVTTKEDSDYHGFGTKSIRYIVEKYGGSVVMEQIQSHFVMRAFFSNTAVPHSRV